MRIPKFIFNFHCYFFINMVQRQRDGAWLPWLRRLVLIIWKQYHSLKLRPIWCLTSYKVITWGDTTFEGVNGFHSNMACFEAPFKGFLTNVKLFKNSIGNMFKSALKGHRKSNFANFEGLLLGDLWLRRYNTMQFIMFWPKLLDGIGHDPKRLNRLKWLPC